MKCHPSNPSQVRKTRGLSLSLSLSPSHPLIFMLFCVFVGVVIHTTDAEAQAAAGAATVDDDELEKLVSLLPSEDSIKGVKMTKLEFEKV